MLQYIQRNLENDTFRDRTYRRGKKHTEAGQYKRPAGDAFTFPALGNDENKHSEAKQEHRNFIFIEHIHDLPPCLSLCLYILEDKQK